ncbi:hypothetical protein [Coleofasciculus sp. G2-EDA-02]|uniref:hypothetical protein n=1 Tax=Coleofasciculus sp. G2-EDA-02 TaxID=3069529 RepID=UPI0032F15A01
MTILLIPPNLNCAIATPTNNHRNARLYCIYSKPSPLWRQRQRSHPRSLLV